MSNATLTIGKVAAATGIKVPTIRYYEQIGLLPAPPRSEGDRRIYGESDVARLGFIRHARELGFGIEQIRTLLALQDDPAQDCAAADSIARARLAEVEERLARLEGLRAELTRMIDTCRHGGVSECRVIETLSDHANCLHHAREEEGAST